ncbi:hypothetical protein ZYGR_0AI07250 [Zygosaccharomyces rouxii]|uniref:PH domain-containing protein n=1 Tax=Zygosaccharomyces rouxii TaxID=4956 RepID=A0A1Q3ACS3_ZYGRO|nr:hypothetical protein ZYGR_0AI07250 [Zygosaccharomyces rouxii]
MGQYNIAEADQVLISSFLKKKGYVSSPDSIKVKQPYSYTGSQPSHAHWWWPSGDHVYWCVLRKGQLSYYKTKDEREAVDVLSRFDVLSYRAIPERTGFNLYTRDKTLSFRAETAELLERWIRALDEFLKVKDERDYCYTEIEETVMSPQRRLESDLSSEEECEAVVFDTAFGLAIVDTDPKLEKAKIANFKNKFGRCNKNVVVAGYENDLEFYKLYDPRNSERIVRSGELYARVKTRFNRTRWKRFKATLTNRNFRLWSVKSGKLRKEISLDKLVDCVEIEDSILDTLFVLVLTDERLKFCSRDDSQVVDWIIAFKCGMLARRKIYKGPQANLD